MTRKRSLKKYFWFTFFAVYALELFNYGLDSGAARKANPNMLPFTFNGISTAAFWGGLVALIIWFYRRNKKVA